MAPVKSIPKNTTTPIDIEKLPLKSWALLKAAVDLHEQGESFLNMWQSATAKMIFQNAIDRYRLLCRGNDLYAEALKEFVSNRIKTCESMIKAINEISRYQG